MQISVIDVGEPTTHATSNGRSYQAIEVTYKGIDGKVSNKKLMSFSNPTVFKTAQTWQKGDNVNIQAVKNDKGYWDWVGFGDSNSSEEQPQAVSQPQSSSKPTTRVTGSNYETKEERAQRQVMIVRQSSLSNAVATLATHGTKLNASQVIDLAKTYEGYVLGTLESSNGIDHLDDDVPF